MASDPVRVEADLAAVVARARRQAEEAGELGSGGGVPAGVEPAEREFILAILRDGTYSEAVAEVARRDPDLATQ